MSKIKIKPSVQSILQLYWKVFKEVVVEFRGDKMMCQKSPFINSSFELLADLL
jgi:hypothetical protein